MSKKLTSKIYIPQNVSEKIENQINQEKADAFNLRISKANSPIVYTNWPEKAESNPLIAEKYDFISLYQVKTGYTTNNYGLVVEKAALKPGAKVTVSVPKNRVASVIGKGGENIKAIQTWLKCKITVVPYEKK